MTEVGETLIKPGGGGAAPAGARPQGQNDPRVTIFDDRPTLILASASPRRQQLLTEAGYAFTVEPAAIDESAFPPSLAPAQVAEHLALAKARAVAQRRTGDVVLAADTVVAFGEQMLGQPADEADARRMLQLLGGTTHVVITGVAVIRVNKGVVRSGRVLTAVRMRFLTANEISAYVATDLWRGKAGGYGIQDRDPFVTRVAGSRSNVVGLPMRLTKQLLTEAGIPPPAVQKTG